MASTWLYLARHGEVLHAAEGRFFGHTDIALSPVGEAQGPLELEITLTGPERSPTRVLVEATDIDPATDPPRQLKDSAEPGVDFEEPEPFVVVDQTTKLEIRINDDKESEGDEQRLVRVAVSWDGEPVYFDVLVTITDDDPSIL